MFQNHQGGREKNFEHSEGYKDKIKEYFEARGYDLIGDSKDDNTTVDQVFRKTYEYGNTDVWVEAKYTSLSRTNKDFLREYALYFIEFQQRTPVDPFELHLIVRELKASSKWEAIFRIAKQNSEAQEEFYDRVLSNEALSGEDRTALKQFSYEDFVEFLTNHTTIHQASYDALSNEVDRLNDSQRYNFDERFTREVPPLNEREELEPNFAEISDLPDKLYVGFLNTAEYDARAVRLKLDRTEPFWFDSNRVFSLRPPDEFPDVIEFVTEMDTVTEKEFDEWAKDPENTTGAISLIQRELCRQFITPNQAEGATAVKYRGSYYLFFEHPNREVPQHKVRDQLVSKAYVDGSSPFVRHRAAQINVFQFNGDYLVSLLVKNLFTTNGKKFSLLRGERNKALHHRFNQNNYNNSQAHSEYRHWRRILNIHNREKDTSGQEIRFRKITEIAINKRPPEDKEEIESQDTDSQQQQFTDFI